MPEYDAPLWVCEGDGLASCGVCLTAGHRCWWWGKRVELVVGLVNVLFVIVDTQSRRLVFTVSRCESLCYWVTRTALWWLKPPPVKWCFQQPKYVHYHLQKSVPCPWGVRELLSPGLCCDSCLCSDCVVSPIIIANRLPKPLVLMVKFFSGIQLYKTKIKIG